MAPAPALSPTTLRDRQRAVDELFTATADYWRSVYDDDDDLVATFYGQRRDLAERWLATFTHPGNAVAFDLGCGAGFLAARLAIRGYRVQASDHAEEMARAARVTAVRDGVTDRTATLVADAHRLPWADGSASAVAALGVIPWLHSPQQALTEAARVLRPGGHVVVSSDNSVRLPHLLDPLLNPLIRPLRRLVASGLRRVGLLGPAGTRERLHPPWRIDRMLRRAGLLVVARSSVGFGPFTLLNRPVLSSPRARRVHERLQRLVDQGRPVLRLLGCHYMVLAQKPELAHEATLEARTERSRQPR